MRHGSLILKDETRNPAHSFKLRGLVGVAISDPGSLSHGIVTVSTGNTGIAAAVTAAALGVPCEVWLVGEPDAAKLRHLASLGVRLRVSSRPFSETAKLASRAARNTGRFFIAPGATDAYIDALKPLFVELQTQVVDFKRLYVPCGGGGLLTAAVRALSGTTVADIIGVQAWSSRPVFDLYHHTTGPSPTKAPYATSLSGDLEDDAAIRRSLGAVSRMILVTRADLRLARRELLRSTGINADPGGVAGVAAAFKEARPGPAVAIITGRSSSAGLR